MSFRNRRVLWKLSRRCCSRLARIETLKITLFLIRIIINSTNMFRLIRKRSDIIIWKNILIAIVKKLKKLLSSVRL